ncbi:hypothetical protein [Thermococcus alcaliphilus]|uniref:hypothetical protein n=1 Tax=Thermococcus alcaliphilus TaxID=139207 RepID=UPI00209196DC|nr:hypothetical protein [Thermococcus alcaliphilus]MCO6040762.1 hypothetical protein [Thermococcus alcaliphilus]
MESEIEEKVKLNIIKISKMPLKLIMEKDFLKLSPEDKIKTLIKKIGVQNMCCHN